jgi:hypothetical protein
MLAERLQPGASAALDSTLALAINVRSLPAFAHSSHWAWHAWGASPIE